MPIRTRILLSFNSKLAQSMIGKQVGENFNFKDEKFEIVGIGKLILISKE